MHSIPITSSLGGSELTDLKKYLWNRYMLFMSDKDYESLFIEKKSREEPIGGFYNMVERAKRANNLAKQKPEMTVDAIIELHERIVFNNPNRAKWEHSDDILKAVKLMAGETVADVGCGHGYYSFKLAQAVANTGKIFALETNDDTLAVFKKTLANHKEITNIIPIRSTYDNCHLPPNSVDVFFMCSVYDAIYQLRSIS
jgi:predicted methyltransferase